MCAAVIGTLWLGSQVTQGQGQPANLKRGRPAGQLKRGQPPDSTAGIQSLAEAGETLAVKSTSEKTGFVTFASSPGRGILVPVDAAAAADQRAMSFVEVYGARSASPIDRSCCCLAPQRRTKSASSTSGSSSCIRVFRSGAASSWST